MEAGPSLGAQYELAGPESAVRSEQHLTPTMGCTVGGLELELSEPWGTVAGRLRGWVGQQPHKRVHTWLNTRGDEQTSWTYRELQMRANAVCHALLHQWGCRSGDRAALMYLPGLDFIAAFWGCLFAGVVAVPVYPVDLRKFEIGVERFGRIVAACEPKLVLSHGEYLGAKRLHAVANIFGKASWPGGLEFEATDGLEPRDDPDPNSYQPRPDDLAFLQFTSGSTGDPKGVMVSHGNLAHNIYYGCSAWDLGADDVAVSWVPQYHDMGLVGYIMAPATIGSSSMIMSPITFLQKPGLWLALISRYKATFTGAPSFAFQRCVDKASDILRQHPIESLSLGQLKAVQNAGEPIQPSTLEHFHQHYWQAGFRKDVWVTSYGLAENVMGVAGFAHTPVMLCVCASPLEDGLVVPGGPRRQEKFVCLVGCGYASRGVDTRIVDSETLAEAAPDRVAEIWVSGPSKAQGYWGKPQLSRDTFRATIKDDPTGTEYLRTGDLGFIHEGELYVCGRLKDLIISNGKNYYPQDIERTAEASHQLLKPGCSAAFSVEANGEERLVVVAEVRGEPSKPTRQAMLEGLRAAVVKEHGPEVQAVVLLKERTVPKTTSGKIKRRACKQGFQEWAGLLPDVGDSTAQLTEVEHWVAPTWKLPQPGSKKSKNACDCCRDCVLA